MSNNNQKKFTRIISQNKTLQRNDFFYHTDSKLKNHLNHQKAKIASLYTQDLKNLPKKNNESTIKFCEDKSIQVNFEGIPDFDSAGLELFQVEVLLRTLIEKLFNFLKGKINADLYVSLVVNYL